MGTIFSCGLILIWCCIDFQHQNGGQYTGLTTGPVLTVIKEHSVTM